MKRIVFVCILIFAFYLIGCVHEHDYTITVISPTCVEEGYLLHECKCGESYKSDFTAFVEHQFGEWNILSSPSETTEGLKERKCNICNFKEEERIPILIHTHVFNIINVIEPTCLDGGYTLYQCDCGESKKDDYTDKIDHQFSEWDVIIEESDFDPGLKQRKCKYCSKTEENTIVDISDMNLVLDISYFTLSVNEEFNEQLSGVLKDDVHIYELESNNFVHSNWVFQVEGLYQVSVIVNFRGYTFRTSIEIEVKNYVNDYLTINLDFCGKIQYVIEYDKYLYLCDDLYIYKYDLNLMQYVDKLNLRCVANSHCIYKGYLYISAHYSFSSFTSKDSECKGTITQIDLSSFKITKQVDVDGYPKSIVVDKRGYVMVGRGNSQHGIFRKINMDTGESTKIFNCYYNDVFYYCEQRDCIVEIDLDTTQQFVSHPYNSSTDTYYYSRNELGIDYDDLLKLKDDLVITKNRYCIFDPTNLHFNSYSIQDYNNMYNNYEVAEYDGEYVYYLGINENNIEGMYDRYIIKNEVFTKDYDVFAIKYPNDSSILNLYSYNGKLYIINSNNELLIYLNK